MNEIKKLILPKTIDDFWKTMLILCGIAFLMNTLLILVTYYFNLNNDIAIFFSTILALVVIGYMVVISLYILLKDVPQVIKKALKRSDNE